MTSYVSPPVEVQGGIRVSVAVSSKDVVMCVSLLAPFGQRRRPVIFCYGLTPRAEASAHAESHVINCMAAFGLCLVTPNVEHALDLMCIATLEFRASATRIRDAASPWARSMPVGDFVTADRFDLGYSCY
jgi:hypothetical protein